MDQHHRPASALDHEVKIRAVDVDETRLGAGMIMCDAARDETLLKATSDLHDRTQKSQ